ncbi:MAG: SAM-dependent methyltransferase [Prevotella sp.]|nr:SAM-dependent methyltransferase [Prevotella sp.]
MNKATIDFIREHADADVRQLALQGKKNPEVDMTYALEQIAGRQKSKTKLPSWAKVDGIVYPPHISMEQCSSEQTARYKAEVVMSANRFVDLTGGFGVDFSFIAKKFKHAVYVERQEHLCDITSENFRLLGLDNAEVVNADGIEYLHQIDDADLIFIDPARRDDNGGRTYGIADCTPNVLEVMDELMQKTDVLLLKLSPMLDWRKAVKDIGGASEVHIVSVDNECKELLIMVKHDAQPIKVVCVNLLSNGNREVFEFGESESHFNDGELNSPRLNPQIESHYLFEPNASIMKAGCFDELQARYPIAQLDNNSHLFVSDHEIPGFPGRQFEILRSTSMNKRELKETLAGIDKANIAVRNFPVSVAELRKKLKLKDGGDVFIFATTVAKEGHQLFICRKIG